MSGKNQKLKDKEKKAAMEAMEKDIQELEKKAKGKKEKKEEKDNKNALSTGGFDTMFKDLNESISKLDISEISMFEYQGFNVETILNVLKAKWSSSAADFGLYGRQLLVYYVLNGTTCCKSEKTSQKEEAGQLALIKAKKFFEIYQDGKPEKASELTLSRIVAVLPKQVINARNAVAQHRPLQTGANLSLSIAGRSLNDAVFLSNEGLYLIPTACRLVFRLWMSFAYCFHKVISRKSKAKWKPQIHQQKWSSQVLVADADRAIFFAYRAPGGFKTVFMLEEYLNTLEASAWRIEGIDAKEEMEETEEEGDED